MAKKIIQEDKQNTQNPTNNFSAENIDMSKPEYTNCNFYMIENAFFGAQNPFMQKQNIDMSQNQQNKEEVEIIKKKMTDYISSMTGFSPEMIERVIDHAEQFMRDNFTDDSLI